MVTLHLQCASHDLNLDYTTTTRLKVVYASVADYNAAFIMRMISHW